MKTLKQFNFDGNIQRSYGEFIDAQISVYYEDLSIDERLTLKDTDIESDARHIAENYLGEDDGFNFPDGRFTTFNSFVNDISDRIRNHYRN